MLGEKAFSVAKNRLNDSVNDVFFAIEVLKVVDPFESTEWWGEWG